MFSVLVSHPYRIPTSTSLVGPRSSSGLDRWRTWRSYVWITFVLRAWPSRSTWGAGGRDAGSCTWEKQPSPSSSTSGARERSGECFQHAAEIFFGNKNPLSKTCFFLHVGAPWRHWHWSRAGPLWSFRDTVAGIWYGRFTSSSGSLRSPYRLSPEDGRPASATKRQSQFKSSDCGHIPCWESRTLIVCVCTVDGGGTQSFGFAEVRSRLAGPPEVSDHAQVGLERSALV